VLPPKQREAIRALIESLVDAMSEREGEMVILDEPRSWGASLFEKAMTFRIFRQFIYFG